MDNDFDLKCKEGFSKLRTDYLLLSGSCALARIKRDSDSTAPHVGEVVNHKMEGAMMCFLMSGRLKLSINFEDHTATAPSVFMVQDGTVVNIEEERTDIDCYVVAYSREFLQEVNISFSAISSEAISERPSPILNLSDNEPTVILRYFKMFADVIADNFNEQINRHILSNLTSAIIYNTMKMVYKRFDVTKPTGIGPRRGGYVHEFIKLVHRYYVTERSVTFYADKLFISPKYLSLLVKEATGQSAAQWIDRFVIREAKNLLRFSGKNIQQVALALNFANQSSFGKYFKHLTGQSPTEFQKS